MTPLATPPRKWPWIVGILGASVFSWAIGGCQGLVVGGSKVPSATTTVTVTVPGKPAPTKTAPPPPPSTGPKVAFSDGSWLVVTEVKPGKYRTITPAEENGRLCFAQVKNGNDYLAQEVSNKGRTIIVVPNVKGAILESSGCGDWEKVG